MNILVACSAPALRADLARILVAHQLRFVDGAPDAITQALSSATGPAALSRIPSDSVPELLIVDGAATEPALVERLEEITTSHPQIGVVLLSAAATSDTLLRAMRAGIREVISTPLADGALEAAVSRLAAKRAGTHAGAPGKILAFIGCKGGCGATFLATNLACQLGEGSSVLLIDLNLQFGDALSFAHDGKPTVTLADVARDIGRLDASLLALSSVRVAPGCSILAAPDDPGQAIDITPAHIDAILSVAAQQYDFVVLDLGRALNPVSIAALDRAHRIYPVLEAGLGAIRNAGTLVEAFAALGYAGEKVELILNRFDSRAHITPDDIKRSVGVVTLRTIPNSYREVATSIQHGELLVRSARANAVVRKLTDLAHSLRPPQQEQKGIMQRFLRRA